MSTADYDWLERIYETSQSLLPVTTGPSCLANAVHFGTNRTRPIHRWFNFKEGFSAELFQALGVEIDVLQDPDSIFLDPFCGSGTTLLAGDLEHSWQARRIGVEINPFIAFVADTKVQWRKYDATRVRRAAASVLSKPLSKSLDHMDIPPLSTFRHPDIFEKSRLASLLDALQRVQQLETPDREPLLLGLAAAAERVGNFRKDGRALRILRRPEELKERTARSVADILGDTWAMMARDLDDLNPLRRDSSVGPAIVSTGDGRVFNSPELRGKVAMIAYSPPYLNHIDYTEVYKVELWLLGLVSSQAEMLALRKQTLRSHASISIAPSRPSLPDDVDESVQLATRMVMQHGTAWHQSFERLSRAYLEDLQTSLSNQLSLLRPGGQAICVVANSAHGAKDHRVPVAVDIWIARMAEAIGFEVERFAVARQLSRRDHLNRYLRETAIVLRKPD